MKKLFGVMGILAVVACAPAHAGSQIVQGTVTNVKPVYTQVVTNVPRDVCKQVQVPIYSNNGQSNNSGNAILGAIIGGVIGNQFGNGSGKEAMTGIGAAIGAVKGSQSGQQNRNIVGYQNTTQCHKEYASTTKNIVNEYDITYNVNGTILTMRVNKAVGNNTWVGKHQRFRIRYQLLN
tara:strand:- start:237 stop:770 length:534 start_codon:yes stop_codon:yes gene_type:complete